MGFATYLKDGFILLSILGLIAVGFAIAIRSDAGSTAVARASGLIRTVVAVSCVLMVLMMAQGAVGFHVGSRW